MNKRKRRDKTTCRCMDEVLSWSIANNIRINAELNSVCLPSESNHGVWHDQKRRLCPTQNGACSCCRPLLQDQAAFQVACHTVVPTYWCGIRQTSNATCVHSYELLYSVLHVTPVRSVWLVVQRPAPKKWFTDAATKNAASCVSTLLLGFVDMLAWYTEPLGPSF